MRRTTAEVVLSMVANQISYTEYVFLKALIAFNASGILKIIIVFHRKLKDSVIVKALARCPRNARLR
jgi:hypothetical protein